MVAHYRYYCAVANVAAVAKTRCRAGWTVVACVALALTVAMPTASAQTEVVIELDFRTEDGQPAGGGTVVTAPGETLTVTPGQLLEIDAGEGEATLQLQPAAGSTVLRVNCDGAERARTIVSGSRATMTIIPGAPVVSCTVTMLVGLPVTGAQSNALAIMGFSLVAAGALALGSARFDNR